MNDVFDDDEVFVERPMKTTSKPPRDDKGKGRGGEEEDEVEEEVWCQKGYFINDDILELKDRLYSRTTFQLTYLVSLS